MSIGEDIFGDQYGYRTRPDAAPVLARLWCLRGAPLPDSRPSNPASRRPPPAPRSTSRRKPGFEASNPLAPHLCEGGQIEACFPRLLPDFLERQILGPSPAGLDFGLAAAAWQLGLQPTEQEHLAFKVPLIAGGAYTVDNLGVESAALHLGLLGQLSVQVRGLPDGQAILDFDTQ